MAGRRLLTPAEERQLLRVTRELAPRDRAIITAQRMTGFRISEILSLTVGSVLRDETNVDAPRHMKDKRGTAVGASRGFRRASDHAVGRDAETALRIAATHLFTGTGFGQKEMFRRELHWARTLSLQDWITDEITETG